MTQQLPSPNFSPFAMRANGPGSMQGKAAVTLVDTGASVNFVDLAFAVDYGFEVHQSWQCAGGWRRCNSHLGTCEGTCQNSVS